MTAAEESPDEMLWCEDPSLRVEDQAVYGILQRVWAAGVDASNSADFRPGGTLDEAAYARYQRNVFKDACDQLRRLAGRS